MKKKHVIYKGRKTALGCGVCTRANEHITSSRHPCYKCLLGDKQFKLVAGATIKGGEDGSED